MEKSKLELMELRAAYGASFISIYEAYRTNMHIANVVKMLEVMEGLFRDYDEEADKIKLKANKNKL